MVYEVAAVGRFDALLDAFDEAGLAFQHVADSFFHYLRGILAFAGGELLELCFGMRCEMNFHKASTVATAPLKR